jgi:DNA mismatch endonuclease, patch repair protein
MDTISKEKRSWNMSRIKGKNTKPELIVRSLLHGMGYRYRLHQKKLPGKPDIVLRKYNTVIFVHGCFWHRHKECKFAYEPKSRQDFWHKKFTENLARDMRNQSALLKLGWKVLVIWECEVGDKDNLKGRITGFLQKG